MHAIRLHTFGPPENLVYEQVQDPEPGPGQVRIAVAAAGVHLIDTTIRAVGNRVDGAGADEAVAMIGTGRTTLAILEVA